MKERMRPLRYPNLKDAEHPVAIPLSTAVSILLKDQKKALREPLNFVIQPPVRPSELMMMRKLEFEVSLMRSDKDNAVILTTGSSHTTMPKIKSYDDRAQYKTQSISSSVHLHTHPGNSSTPSVDDLFARATDTGQESFILSGEGVVSFAPEHLHPFSFSHRASLGLYGKRTLKNKGILKRFEKWDSPHVRELLEAICDRLNGADRKQSDSALGSGPQSN